MTTDDDGRQLIVHLSNLGNISIYNKNIVTTANIELSTNKSVVTETNKSIHKQIYSYPKTVKLSKNKF